jgi:hypothetical protein
LNRVSNWGFAQVSLGLWSSYFSLPHSWDCRHAPLCPACFGGRSH